MCDFRVRAGGDFGSFSCSGINLVAKGHCLAERRASVGRGFLFQ
jgi:hypothetical protein